VSIRIAIADDEGVVRAGLRMILEAEDDLQVAGEAADGAEAIEVVRRTKPDVALMDIRMPGTDGITAARTLTSEGTDTRIVMLTTFDQDEYLYEALRAGTSGFLLKAAPPEQLVAAIRTVAAGDALLAPAVTRRVIEAFADRGGPPAKDLSAAVEELTARELEVLTHLARGESNAEIARAFVVEESTVKTHVARVLMKLGLRDRIQAVVFAYESGLVRAGEGNPAAAGDAYSSSPPQLS
jgi:DNA-binding NarL/FixJ family response regulator